MLLCGSLGWRLKGCLECVPVTGILEYMLVMSREANMGVGVIGVFFSSWISSAVFLMLNEYGSGVICLIFEVKSLDSL
jgi:hypothetical protein